MGGFCTQPFYDTCPYPIGNDCPQFGKLLQDCVKLLYPRNVQPYGLTLQLAVMIYPCNLFYNMEFTTKTNSTYTIIANATEVKVGSFMLKCEVDSRNVFAGMSACLFPDNVSCANDHHALRD